MHYYIQRSLTQLTSLDLYNCPVTNLNEYRSQVFGLLSSLKSLDGHNEKGEEIDSEGEDGREDEEEDDDDDDDEPGLDYLLNNDLRSVSVSSMKLYVCKYGFIRTVRKVIMTLMKMNQTLQKMK